MRVLLLDPSINLGVDWVALTGAGQELVNPPVSAPISGTAVWHASGYQRLYVLGDCAWTIRVTG